jgi:Meckel syndrome type 1 protein
MIYGTNAEGKRGLYVAPNDGIPGFLKRTLKLVTPATADHPKEESIMNTVAATTAEAPKAQKVAKAPKAAPAPKAKAAKANGKAKPKATAKAAPKAAAKTKTPKAAAAGSKTEQVLAMLKKGATRTAIVEATGWQVDLKQLAARKGLKLSKDKDGVITAR